MQQRILKDELRALLCNWVVSDDMGRVEDFQTFGVVDGLGCWPEIYTRFDPIIDLDVNRVSPVICYLDSFEIIPQIFSWNQIHQVKHRIILGNVLKIKNFKIFFTEKI